MVVKVLALALAAGALLVALGEEPEPQYPKALLRALAHRTRCDNADEVLQMLNFTPSIDPYPARQGYDTRRELGKSCFVEFTDPAARREANATLRYRLLSLEPQAAARRNATGAVFLTHAEPCGACSPLDQLAVYLEHRDLTSPVRKCAIVAALPGGHRLALQCLERLGFAGACKYIWLYNAMSSREQCLAQCLTRLDAPNNEPRKRPMEGNPCDPAECGNTINGAPACSGFQWQDGPFRLNPCLQCDECKSGPVFQRVAGRTRRNSGVESGIRRPPSEVQHIDHHYGIQVALDVSSSSETMLTMVD